ncbi:hypothetical protein [Micromonospora sp. WMMD1274]|uniref:hypothetical protein n=1 Tax=Micromonospora sp. WMMD1274 TaxID=3404116 RepID=UPI003B9654CA
MLPTCTTHGPINGYELRDSWSFTEAGRVEGMRSYVLSCGCEHVGADLTTREILSAEETPDGSRVIELSIIDFMEQPVITWREIRPALI